MAWNLLRAGHRVALYNRTREKAEAVASGAEAETATVVDSPVGAAVNAEAVFTMLADDAAVDDVVFGPGGIADGLPEGAIHISSSNIPTGLARPKSIGARPEL